MSARFGFLGGVLGLTALEIVVTSTSATGNVSGAMNALAGVLTRLMDPTIAAIPDLRTGSSAPSSYTGGSATLPLPAPSTSPAVPAGGGVQSL